MSVARRPHHSLQNNRGFCCHWFSLDHSSPFPSKKLLCLGGMIPRSPRDRPGSRVWNYLPCVWGKWSLWQKRKWVTNWIYGHYSLCSPLPSVISIAVQIGSLSLCKRSRRLCKEKAGTSPAHPIKSQIVIKQSLRLLWFTFILMVLFVEQSLSWGMPSGSYWLHLK